MKYNAQNKYCLLYLSLFIVAMLAPKTGAGQEERFSGAAHGAPISSSTIVLAQDDKFGTTAWSTINYTRHVKNIVAFEIDEDDFQIKPQSFTYEASLEIKKWEAGSSPSGSPTSTDYVTLSVEYDSTSTSKTEHKAFVLFEGAHKIEVEVLSISPVGAGWNTYWPPMKVSADILVNRKYDYNCALSPSLIDSVFTGTRSGDLEIKWEHFEGAEEYELEWSFYDSLSNVGEQLNTTSIATYDNFDWIFRNNATRVITPFTKHNIPLLYPNGFLFVRLRAVQYDSTGVRKTSTWTSDGQSGTISSFQHYAQISWHQEDLNWQAQTTFAEEGKHIPSVNYFDGSLRQRQSITRSNSIGMSIASQSIYDHYGRPAVNIIPAPTFVNDMGFQPLFAAKDTSVAVPYSKLEFDFGDCGSNAKKVSDDYGVGKYFSPNNPNSSSGKHQFIPDGEGYPFSVTEYTPDGTGRVSRQSGVGEDMQLNSGHETKYLYSKPSQGELDRLFGNEAGLASHYLKNSVIDPNGQMSISYIDAHGRTVATALAGSKPAFAMNDGNEPEYPPVVDTIEVDLLNNQIVGQSLVSSFTLVPEVEGQFVFKYTADTMSFQPECGPSEVCYDCLYDLELKITDECGNGFNAGSPVVHSMRNFTFGSFLDTLCTNPPAAIVDSFALTLYKGETYYISKVLTVSQSAAEEYAGHFLSQPTCVPNLDSMIAEFQSSVDLGGCGMTCESCYDDLGEYSAFETEYFAELGITSPQQADYDAAQAEYDYLLEQCDDICSGKTECEILYNTLLLDVSPGGQYATYERDLNGNITVPDKTSIFYQNIFQTIPDSMSAFYPDAEGNPDSIFHNGQWKSPENLNHENFILYWKPSWAIPLAKLFHPEYCYYERCKEEGPGNSYDSTIVAIDDYEVALDSLVVDSSGNFLNDPYFAVTGTGHPYTALRDSFMNYSVPGDTSSPSMLDIVSKRAYRYGEGDCNTYFGQGKDQENNVAWKLLRTFYLGVKRRVKAQAAMDGAGPGPACDNSCIGSSDPGCGPNNLYENKIKRYYSSGTQVDSIDIDIESIGTDSLANLLAEDLGIDIGDLKNDAYCKDICNIQAEQWMINLSMHCGNISAMDSAAIRERLIAVCEKGCTALEDTPVATSSSFLETQYGDRSFEDVLDDYISSELSSCDSACNLGNLGFPASVSIAQSSLTGAQPIIRVYPEIKATSRL